MARENDLPDLKASNVDAKMWAVLGEGYFPCEESVKELPAGQYTIAHTQDRGIFFHRKSVNLDDLMTLPDSASQAVLNEITTFWTKEEKYRKFKFLWKRGILLWGPPGSGKTSTVQLISKLIVDKGGISVYVSQPKLAAVGLEMMRKIEPKRPIVVMLEDLDAIISGNHGSEADLLALLDGELQIDNVVFIATTNYPEKLDKRIVNRPSRFDLVKKIGMPTADARRSYILAKEPEAAKNVIEVIDEEMIKTAEDLLLSGERNRSEALVAAKDLLSRLEADNSLVTELETELELEKFALSKAQKEAQKAEGDEAEQQEPKRKSKSKPVQENDLKDKIEALSTNLANVKDQIARSIEELAQIEQAKIDAEAEIKRSAEIKAQAAKKITELDYWVDETEGFSIAHIKELILAIRCFEQPFRDVIRRLRAMSKPPSSSDRDGGMFSR